METITPAQETTRQMLQELGIPANRIGYRFLCAAIPCYAQDSNQSVTKELYPAIGKAFGYSNGCAVERAIRGVILDATEHNETDVWKQYFPRCRKAPSNSLFIATLAECLK